MLGTAAEIDAVPFCVRESIKAGTGSWYNPKSKTKNATFSTKCCIFYLHTSTMLLRIQHQLSHVSVMLIWLRRWLSTARTTFLLRLDSPCLHRLTRLHREFSPYSANSCLILSASGGMIIPHGTAA